MEELELKTLGMTKKWRNRNRMNKNTGKDEAVKELV